MYCQFKIAVLIEFDILDTRKYFDEKWKFSLHQMPNCFHFTSLPVFLRHNLSIIVIFIIYIYMHIHRCIRNKHKHCYNCLVCHAALTNERESRVYYDEIHIDLSLWKSRLSMNFIIIEDDFILNSSVLFDFTYQSAK